MMMITIIYDNIFLNIFIEDISVRDFCWRYFCGDMLIDNQRALRCIVPTLARG